jgi:hypothetical protein
MLKVDRKRKIFFVLPASYQGIKQKTHKNQFLGVFGIINGMVKNAWPGANWQSTS